MYFKQLKIFVTFSRDNLSQDTFRYRYKPCLEECLYRREQLTGQ